MKLWMLLPDLRGGGAERVTLDLAQEFRRLGHDPELVVLRARGEFLGEALSKFRIHELDCERTRQAPFRLARHLRRNRPDALFASMWPLTAIAPIAQRLSGHRCPVVVSEHNMLSIQYGTHGLWHRAAMRATTAFGYRLATARVAVSSGVADDIARLSGVEAGEFTVVHNPVPRQVSPPSELLKSAEDLWAKPRGARILNVASLKKQKNHALLLHAFARMRRSDAQLMIVGQGRCEAELRKLSIDLGVSDRVCFTGFREDPTPFFSTADLFVLSSDYEGFGNVIVEALSQGLTVVSTDCPSGPAEILAGGLFGRLVQVGDVQGLAEAMDEALVCPYDREALVKRASDFAPEVAAIKYLELI